MHKKGFTLIEIIVATIILAVILAGFGNIFVAGKGYIINTRDRMAGGELGKFFLDPFQSDVRMDQWVGGVTNDYSNGLAKKDNLAAVIPDATQAINRLTFQARYRVDVPTSGGTNPITVTEVSTANVVIDPLSAIDEFRRVRANINWSIRQP